VLFGYAGRMESEDVDVVVSGLARRSPNFGFLATLEPLLVIDGVAAESYVYTDPDAAMVKARRFTETLAKELVVRTRTRVARGTQQARIQALADEGVLVPHIRDAFDRVRRTGNRAAHCRFGDVRAAVDAIRTCFELGVWLHQAITGDLTVRPFVPPPDPRPDQALLSDEDRAQLSALHDDLNLYRRRITKVLIHKDHADSTLMPRNLPGRSPIVQLLIELTTIAEQSDDPGLAGALYESAVGLIRQRLGPANGFTPRTRRFLRMAHIQTIIRRRVGDPTLDPDRIAKAANISPRYLHQLFQDAELTPMQLLKSIRLEECRRRLQDPALALTPIKDLIARHGYSRLDQFARDFKQLFGVPANQVRAYASQRPTMHES